MISSPYMQRTSQASFTVVQKNEDSTAKFETGLVYGTRSICDSNCIFRFKIVRRTAKSVWVEEVRNGEALPETQKRRSIYIYENAERIKPNGSHSMCAILCADRDENDCKR